MPEFNGYKVLEREINKICDTLNENAELELKGRFECDKPDHFILKMLLAEKSERHFQIADYYSCQMSQANILVKSESLEDFDDAKLEQIMNTIFEGLSPYIKKPKSIEKLENLFEKREIFEFAGDVTTVSLRYKDDTLKYKSLTLHLTDYYLKKFIEEEKASTPMRASFLQEKVLGGIEGFQRVISTDLSQLEGKYYGNSLISKDEENYFTIEDEKYVWVGKTLMKILLKEELPSGEREKLNMTKEELFQLISIPEIIFFENPAIFEFLFGYLNDASPSEKEVFEKALTVSANIERIPNLSCYLLADNFSKLNKEAKRFLYDFFINNHELSKEYDPANMFLALASQYSELPEDFRHHLNQGLLVNEDMKKGVFTNGQVKVLSKLDDDFFKLLPQDVATRLKEIKGTLEDQTKSNPLSDFEKLLG